MSLAVSAESEEIIKTIEFEPIEIIEGTNCSMQSDWDFETFSYGPEYQKYSFYNSLNYNITFEDDTTYSSRNKWFTYKGQTYWISASSNQSYENQWTVGNTYSIDVTVANKTVTVPVKIVASPIKSIQIQPISIIENSNGYTSTGYNPSTGNYDLEYYYYSVYDKIKYEITFNDDTVVKGSGSSFDYNGEWESFNISSNQSYDNQWTVGNTYNVDVSVLGKTVTVPVTIIESPVSELKIEPISITEYTGGYYYQTGTSKEYYWYSLSNKIKYEIKFSDGSTEQGSGSSFEYDGEWYSFQTSDNQSYDNQWTVGNTYNVDVSVLGKTVTVPVSIVPSPVKSVKIEPISIIENTNGYTTTEYNSNTGNYDLEYYKYSLHRVKYEITFNDDTVVKGSGSGFNYNGEWYSFNISSNQSYDNQWTVGNTYELKVSALGKITMVPVTITPTPIKELKIEPIVLEEYIDGYYKSYYNPDTGNYDLEYYYYSVSHRIKYEITLNDDTVVKDSDSGFDYNDEWYSFDISSNQSSDNQWTVGNTYEATVYVLGTTVTVPVTIAENNVASIEIVNSKNVTELSYASTPETPKYYIPDFSYRINYKNGTSVILQYDGYSSFVRVSDNQSTTPWTADGENTVTVEYAGKTATFNAKFQTQSEYEYIEQGGGLYITNCLLQEETLEIPSTINGKTVLGIMSLGNALLKAKKVIIPDSVKYLSDGLFIGPLYTYSQNLETVEIGAGVSNLSIDMFGENRNLKEINISKNNPNYKSVDGVAYDKSGKTVIAYPIAKGTTYNVPNEVTNIDIFSKYELYSDVNLVISENSKSFVKEDGILYSADKTKVFSCDKDKTGEYIMPDTVTEIAEGAFKESSLDSVKVSNKVTDIVYLAFAYSNISKVELPSNLQTISDGAFSGANLTSITLPATLTKIGASAFASNYSLTEVTIPGSVKTIERSSFYGCSLEKLVLQEGTVSIEAYAFCFNSISELKLPNSLVSIGEMAFYCSSVESITFGNSLTTIGRYAFSANNLTELNLPQTVTELTYNSFSGNIQLADISIPESVKKVDTAVFEGTQWSKSNEDGYSNNILFNVCGNEFNGYSDDTELVVKDGTRIIANEAVAFMYKLTSVTLPNSLITIGDEAFCNCISLETIYIPASVEYIGIDSFNRCDSLKSINVDPNNKYYSSENGVLYNKDKTDLIFCPIRSESSFTVPDSVEHICRYAFEYNDVSKIIINNDDIVLEENALSTSNYFDELYAETKGAKKSVRTIVCNKDSNAYNYAVNNLLYYQPINQIAGDVNSDGNVDTKDLVRLKKYLAGQNVEIAEFSADCNGDQTVDSKDLVRFKKYLAGQSVVLGA